MSNTVSGEEMDRAIEYMMMRVVTAPSYQPSEILWLAAYPELIASERMLATILVISQAARHLKTGVEAGSREVERWMQYLDRFAADPGRTLMHIYDERQG